MCDTLLKQFPDKREREGVWNVGGGILVVGCQCQSSGVFSFSFIPTNERTDIGKRFPSSMPNLCPKIIQALSLSADAHSHPLVRMHSGTAARGTGQYRRHTSSRSRSIIWLVRRITKWCFRVCLFSLLVFIINKATPQQN
jgi:hypothetical protein